MMIFTFFILFHIQFCKHWVCLYHYSHWIFQIFTSCLCFARIVYIFLIIVTIYVNNCCFWLFLPLSCSFSSLVLEKNSEFWDNLIVIYSFLEDSLKPSYNFNFQPSCLYLPKGGGYWPALQGLPKIQFSMCV